MIDLLEVRNLAIAWSDRNTVIKIEESLDCLTLEEYDSDSLYLESMAFPKVHGYLGFSFDEELKHVPYFEKSNGEKEYLISFKSPRNNKIWWIQNSGWDKKNKRYYSEIYRTVGYLNLIIQDTKVVIQNNYIDFTVDELEHYLSDFKNDLWMLILDENNPATAKINKEAPSFMSDETISLYKDFLIYAENLIKKPNMYLMERLNTLPIKQIKPVPKTFRQLIESPTRKTAISRDFYESYDTSENRYIHYCIDKVSYLIKSLERLSKSQLNLFTKKIEQESLWLSRLNELEEKVVDKDVLQYEIDSLNQSMTLLEGLKVDNQVEANKRVELEVGYKHGYFLNTFFVESIGSTHKSEFKNRFDLDYILISFNDLVRFKGFDIELFAKNVRCFTLAGDKTWKPKTNDRGGKKYRLCILETLDYLDFDSWQTNSAIGFQRLVARKNELESKDWVMPLDKDERDSKNKEIMVATKKLDVLKAAQEDVKGFYGNLPSIQARLKRVLSFFQDFDVKKSHRFSNSMVFIQNPSYAGCNALFRKIINDNGLDISLLETMMKIDEIGLVNISNLYERWCLIQIIKTIKDEYKFIPQDNWQEVLIKSIVMSENVRNVEVWFNSYDGQRTLRLTYEKELSSGRRPDFVIDLYLADDVDSSIKRRMVLDAKFKKLNQKSHNELIEQLYYPTDDSDKLKPTYRRHKNYSEYYNNQVFIIHPTPLVIETPTSPLEWGRFCDYGQSHKNEHRYGGIFLTPSYEYPHTQENLKRLIALFLQRHYIQPHVESTDAGFQWKYLFCVSCGNNEPNKFQVVEKKTGYRQSRNTKWETICLKCNQYTLLTLCYECRNPSNAIFKNGWKWTYHSARAESISNLVCSKCENFLQKMEYYK